MVDGTAQLVNASGEGAGGEPGRLAPRWEEGSPPRRRDNERRGSDAPRGGLPVSFRSAGGQRAWWRATTSARSCVTVSLPLSGCPSEGP